MQTNLGSIYKDLLTKKMTCEEARDVILSSDVRENINAFINKEKINKLVPYSDEDLQDIYMLINITQFIYNNSGVDTGLSDSEYDTLYAIMLSNGGSDVISVPISPTSENIAFHKYPNLRGSLTKIHYLTNDEEKTNPSRRYLDEWKSSMENKIYNNSGEKINLDNQEVYIFPKFDGVSAIFEIDENGQLERVLTRGFTETNEAEDITHHFKYIFKKRINPEFRKCGYGLKTEIMMTENDLKYYNEKYGTDYKNTRSIVSAILNSDEYDDEKSRLLHIVPLRVGNIEGDQELANDVFDYPFVRCRLKDREFIREFADKNRYINDGLRCDGAVIYIIDDHVQNLLGRENHKNNYEVAYKFTEECTLTKLKGIEFNLGLFGRLAPVAIVDPVKLKGNTIKNISLGSVGRFNSLGLRKGDTVKIIYDIIPYLIFDSDCKRSNGELLVLPDRCPECNEEITLNETGQIATCENPKCPCRIKGKILNYLNKMNIDGISYGIIDKLYEFNIVKKIEDLYKLDKHINDMMEIEGFGIKKIQMLLKAIDDNRTVPDYIFLGSLGIESIAKKRFQLVMELYTIDELLDLVTNYRIDKLSQIRGLSELNAAKLINGIIDNKNIIIKLKDKYLNIITTKGDNKNKSKFTVCFTKIRDKEKEKFIRELGGEITDNITKSTSFLVVPDLAFTKSSKVTQATKKGVKIISIDQLEKEVKTLLGKNY